MNYLKLEEGAPITLTISDIEPSEGKFGPQYLFIGTSGDRLYVSENSTLRGLERLKLDVTTCIGETIRFSRVIKNGTKYTNLDRAAAGSQTAPAAASSAPAPAQHQKAPVDLPTIAELYSECVSIAMATLGAKCEEAGVPIDASAIQAAAATLFIRASR